MSICYPLFYKVISVYFLRKKATGEMKSVRFPCCFLVCLFPENRYWFAFFPRMGSRFHNCQNRRMAITAAIASEIGKVTHTPEIRKGLMNTAERTTMITNWRSMVMTRDCIPFPKDSNAPAKIVPIVDTRNPVDMMRRAEIPIFIMVSPALNSFIIGLEKRRTKGCRKPW